MVGGFANFFTVKMTNASPNYHFVCGTNSYSNFVAQLEGIKRKKEKKKLKMKLKKTTRYTITFGNINLSNFIFVIFIIVLVIVAATWSGPVPHTI